jgi:Helix-turn-helix domain
VIEKEPVAANSDGNSDALLDPHVVARMLGVSEGSLYAYRRSGIGPAFVQFGTGRKPIIRYRLEDVQSWILKHRVEATK